MYGRGAAANITTLRTLSTPHLVISIFKL